MTSDRVLVLGVGNDLLGDDAAGLVVADRLRDTGVPVDLTTRSGLGLLDHVVGFDRVLLIDSQTTGREAGTVDESTLEPSEIRGPSAHYLSYGEALALGACLEMPLPREIKVLAVECLPQTCIGGPLTAPVREALPLLEARAREILRDWCHARPD
jgi:hydrogenase maturation protease